jgi:diaminohydroxyphosphoribosylaminopyrimidine deaminase/5-amino-6-(5-phosphoribosylamino)uracil reductase
MADPDPRVSGRGIALLREAGVTVDVGLLETEARRLNRAYIHHRQTGKPFVTLKLAQSLDGRVATASGHSQWITGTDARVHVHRMRSESDGVLVGIGSALADDPQLTARHVKGRQPRRIVLDSLARTPLHARLLDGSAPTLVCVTDHAPGERIHALLETGAEVLILPRNDEGHVDIHALKKELGQRQIVTLMVEGGHKVATSFLRAQEVDRVVFFVAPILIGAGLDAVGDLKVNTLLDALKLDEVSVEHIGADIMITGYPVYPTLK